MGRIVDGYNRTSALITEHFQATPGDIYRDADDQAANFYQFPYDWRRDNRANAHILKKLLEQRLRRWREASGNPMEFAYEAAFDGKERHGALTYWMLDTLVSSRSSLTYQSLYHRVKGQIQSKFPNQLPLLLGEGDRLVFGDKREINPILWWLLKFRKIKQRLPWTPDCHRV
ncbi:MAG: hypothetical protein VKN60_07635 [Cyanobacteriota bacterium]|nr:hypothetical protein [Cyanobacteriota bacterium]